MKKVEATTDELEAFRIAMRMEKEGVEFYKKLLSEAKTEKEKLRFNMFGHRPLNLKRTLLMFLVIYIVFLMVIHAFAYDSISSSVGVKAKPADSNTNFGRVQPGKETRPQEFPLINPSVMPVKGIIFGKGEMREFISRQTFQLERGEIKSTLVKATIPNGTANGSYLGEIALYSSPFWFIFPDDFILELIGWNPEATIIILDLLSAVFLTLVTFFLLITFTFIGERIAIFSINRSLQTPLKPVIKKRTVIKAVKFRKNARGKIGKGLGWIMRVDFSDHSSKETTFSKIGKPIIASLAIIPIIFLIKDQMLAMIFAVVIAGIIAYFISCKLRNKIVLTVMFTMILSIIHMTFNSNLIILSKEPTMLELMALLSGTIGIYLLLFSLILIPLSLLSWYITRLFRNLKERKDPLLSLEGSCDL